MFNLRFNINERKGSKEDVTHETHEAAKGREEISVWRLVAQLTPQVTCGCVDDARDDKDEPDGAHTQVKELSQNRTISLMIEMVSDHDLPL